MKKVFRNGPNPSNSTFHKPRFESSNALANGYHKPYTYPNNSRMNSLKPLIPRNSSCSSTNKPIAVTTNATYNSTTSLNPFSIPRVISNIMKYLPVSTRRGVRLLSKDWNKIACTEGELVKGIPIYLCDEKKVEDFLYLLSNSKFMIFTTIALQLPIDQPIVQHLLNLYGKYFETLYLKDKTLKFSALHELLCHQVVNVQTLTIYIVFRDFAKSIRFIPSKLAAATKRSASREMLAPCFPEVTNCFVWAPNTLQHVRSFCLQIEQCPEDQENLPSSFCDKGLLLRELIFNLVRLMPNTTTLLIGCPDSYGANVFGPLTLILRQPIINLSIGWTLKAEEYEKVLNSSWPLQQLHLNLSSEKVSSKMLEMLLKKFSPTLKFFSNYSAVPPDIFIKLGLETTYSLKSFPSMTFLTQLELQLTSIPPDLFDNCPLLTQLRLRPSSLEEILEILKGRTTLMKIRQTSNVSHPLTTFELEIAKEEFEWDEIKTLVTYVSLSFPNLLDLKIPGNDLVFEKVMETLPLLHNLTLWGNITEDVFHQLSTTQLRESGTNARHRTVQQLRSLTLLPPLTINPYSVYKAKLTPTGVCLAAAVLTNLSSIYFYGDPILSNMFSSIKRQILSNSKFYNQTSRPNSRRKF